MTLLFCESFDTIADSTDAAQRGWVYLNAWPPFSSGRYGTGMYLADTRYSMYRWIPTTSTFVIGFALRITGAPAGNYYYVRLYDGTVCHLSLVMLTTNKLAIYRGASTTHLGTCSTTLVTGAWNYIEFKCNISDTVGAPEIRINGNTETITWVTGDGTNQDTRNGGNASIDQIRFGYGGGSSSMGGPTFDDLYLCDDQGSYNNTFLGDVRVQALLPSGAGSNTGWTASAGSNYACVDEATPNDDTDYIYTSTASTKDTYAYGNLTPTSGDVKAIQWVAMARKDDAGTRTIAPVYRPSSTDYDGSTKTLGDAYVAHYEITETNPATSASWTISEVNGSEFGAKLVG